MTERHDFPQPDPLFVLAYVWHVGPLIVGVGHCRVIEYEHQNGPEGAERVVVPEALARLIDDPAAWWWNGDTAVPRESSGIDASGAMVAANGADEVAITGIPPGARLWISGTMNIRDLAVDDDHLALTTTQPGLMRVRIVCPPPYLTWEHDIHAT